MRRTIAMLSTGVVAAVLAMGVALPAHADEEAPPPEEQITEVLPPVDPPVEEIIEEVPEQVESFSTLTVVEPTTYTITAWEMPSWVNSTTPSWPQSFETSAVIETADLAALDSQLTQCDSQWQVDIHYSGSTVDALIAGGYLNGPNDPPENLIPGGWGTAYKLVQGPSCPEIVPEVCEAATELPTSTNLDPRGYELEAGEYVDGGVLLTASNWSDAYAYVAANFPLSAAANLDLDITIDGAGVWAVILETAGGNVHYEPEPYTMDLWTEVPGILPLSPGGQGGTYAGNLDDLVSDPTVTGVYFYFSTGSADPVEALLASGSVNCTIQPFDYAEPVELPTPPVTEELLPVTGTDDLVTGIMLAIAALLLGVGGVAVYATRRIERTHQ